MTTSAAIQTIATQIPNGDLQIDAYLAHPQASGSYPGIVVIQEIFGVNAHIRSVTDRIAQQGYVAIAPAIYQRTAPGFEVGYTPEAIAEGRRHKEMTTAAQLLSDLQATLTHLKTLPQVKPPFGTIGFCFGGHVAYLAATLSEIQATASFYGAGIATLTPGGGDPTLSRTPEIQGTVYAFFGEQDPLIPRNQIEAVTAALAAQSPQHKVFRYPEAGHGFFCDQRADYQAAAAQDAWQKVLELFHTLK